MTGYVHGYATPEQERLISQAEHWRHSLISAGTDLEPGTRLLEVGCGVGAVLAVLGQEYPGLRLSGVDIEPRQLEFARVHLERAGVEASLTQADALALPFDDGSFDAVVCQFGVMFFPDKRQAFAEARRVLAPGGVLLFNVWDRIDENEFADTITSALEAVFPADPPRFLPRTPYGYYDKTVIEEDLLKAGFLSPPGITTLAARSLAGSPRVPAIAFCKGTPLRNEIEARDASRLCGTTDLASDAIARRFGAGPVDGKIQAHVVMIER